MANAIRNQNLDAPAGVLGQQPAPSTQAFELPINTLGRLTTTEQFGDLIVKADQGRPPPPPGAPPTPSTGPHGLPTLGTTGPLDTGADSGASGVTMATGDTTPGTGNDPPTQTEVQVYVDDFWQWDGRNWTQVTYSRVPYARENGGLAWDPSTQMMVIFGGYAGQQYLSDLWTLTPDRGWQPQITNVVRRRSTGRP